MEVYCLLTPASMTRLSLLLALFLAPSVLAQTHELVGDPVYVSEYDSRLFSRHYARLLSVEEMVAPGLLQELTFGERTDTLCFIEGRFLKVDGTGEMTKRIEICDPTSRSLKTIGRMSSSVSSAQVIFSLSTVYVSDAQQSAGFLWRGPKGVRIERRKLAYNSQGVSQFDGRIESDEFRRPNAEDAHTFGERRRQCPFADNGAPMVAVGLSAGWFEGRSSGRDGDDSLDGLGLICQEIRRLPTPPPTPSGPVTSATRVTPVGVSGPGWLTRQYRLAGDIFPRGRSGGSGQNTVDHMGRGDFVLYGMEFGERSDTPCYLRTYWWNARNGRDNVQTRTETFNGCNGTPRSVRYVGPNHSEIEGTSEDLRMVTGLAVCNNSRRGPGRKLKGATLETHAATGTRMWRETPSFERPNCSSNHWGEMVSCSPGQVVVGLEIHRNTLAGRASITGLAPQCRQLMNSDQAGF